MGLVNTTGSGSVLQDTLSIVSGLSSPTCTITYWFKCTSYPHSGSTTRSVQAVHSVGIAGSEDDELGIEGPGGSSSDSYISGGGLDTGPEADFGPSANFTGWQIVTFTVDGSGNWVFSTTVEGGTLTEVNSGTLSGSGIITNHYLSRPQATGARSAAASKFAHVKIWNGIVLTAAQLVAEAASGPPILLSKLYSYVSCGPFSTIGHTEQGSAEDWTVTGTGLTLDSDMPAVLGLSTSTIRSGGAYLERSSGSLITSSFTLIKAFKYSAAVTGFFPCAGSIMGTGGPSGNPANDLYELYQDDGSGGAGITDAIGVFTRDGFNTPVGATLGSNASLVGKWIHMAIVMDATAGSYKIYTLVEGFNPSSPSFLFTPTVVASSSFPANSTNFIRLWTDNDFGIDLGVGVSIGHEIVCAAALTQSQVIAQFRQRAPISAVTAVSYTYLECDGANLTAVGTDLGSTASNFTITGNSGGAAFTQDSTQPSEWTVPIPIDVSAPGYPRYLFSN